MWSSQKLVFERSTGEDLLLRADTGGSTLTAAATETKAAQGQRQLQRHQALMAE